MCVAGLELSMFNLKTLPNNTFYLNNQPIISKQIMKSELKDGINELLKYNSDSYNYYNQLLQYIHNC
jgi:hypothetical protein